MADSSFDPDRWQRIGELFRTASELRPSDRRHFLEKECDADEALRTEVEELLAADEKAAGLLDHPAVLISESEAATVDSKPERKPFQPGEILAQRFKIIQLLGKGGMGHVYEAEDLELGTHVAVKFLRAEIALDPRARQRFHREITLARRVTHPNACRIFDLFRHEDTAFLTMELLKGETLSERIKRSGPFDISEALPLIEGMAAGLSAAHEVGIVHRDFKSGNVMLVPNSDGTRAVITDFGLATSTMGEESGRLSISETGAMIGTPEFMSPEQLQSGKITPAADIYAFGLVIYQMITGKLPFEGDTPFQIVNKRLHRPAPSPREHVPQLDRKWERTILRCLERDPSDRFQTPGEVVTALKGEGSTIRILPKHRYRVPIVLSLIALLLVAGAIVFMRQGTEMESLPKAAIPFEKRDWILITKFENRTGEEVLDGTIEFALEGELSSSQFVNIVPRQRIEDALRLMRKPVNTIVNPEIGREIAVRDGAIKALLSGEVRTVGTSYAMNVRLVDPAREVVLKAFHREARNQDEILTSVRQISSEIRKALGGQLSHVQGKDRTLPPVTTRSLKALRLFAQADSLIGGLDNDASEELIRQAIHEDPDFAMGQIYLAHAIRNEGRSSKEYMPPAEKAFALSEDVSERERYFIRGSYYSMKNDLEKAMTNYRALLQLHPDDYWANNNMHNTLAFVFQRYEEAVPYAVRMADTRPNGFKENYRAALDLSRWGNRPDEALKYADRAKKIIESGVDIDDLYQKMDIEFFQTRQRWIRGDIPGALEEIEGLAASLNKRTGRERNVFIDYQASSYLMLGKLERARDIYQMCTDESIVSQAEVIIAFLRKDRPGIVAALKRQTAAGKELNALDVTFRAQSGLVQEARSLLKSLQEQESRERPRPFPFFRVQSLLPMAEGQILLAIGKEEAGLSSLQKCLEPADSIWSITSILASESVARVLDQHGDTESALQILLHADQRKQSFGHGGLVFWMHLRAQMAKLYRKQGRNDEADRIEADLKNRLRFADPDFTLSYP